MEEIIIYLLMKQIILNLKQQIFKIAAIPLCLGNISEDFSTVNMKKTGLHGYVYDFSVNYDAIEVSDILDIHKLLMREWHIIKCLDLLRECLL